MLRLIRQADAEDAPLLPAIEKAAASLFRTVPGLEFVADHTVMSVRDHLAIQKSGVTFVAQSLEGTDAGEVVGFLCARHETGGVCHVVEMSVHPSRQGQGIGSALMAAALDDAIASRCKTATLTTFKDVPWNEGFYKKLGFVPLDEAALEARLAAILDQEVANGLPRSRRCAMALALA
jgi:GNAT superfamily N-acetyltransferase